MRQIMEGTVNEHEFRDGMELWLFDKDGDSFNTNFWNQWAKQRIRVTVEVIE